MTPIAAPKSVRMRPWASTPARRCCYSVGYSAKPTSWPEFRTFPRAEGTRWQSLIHTTAAALRSAGHDVDTEIDDSISTTAWVKADRLTGSESANRLDQTADRRGAQPPRHCRNRITTHALQLAIKSAAGSGYLRLAGRTDRRLLTQVVSGSGRSGIGGFSHAFQRCSLCSMGPTHHSDKIPL